MRYTRHRALSFLTLAMLCLFCIFALTACGKNSDPYAGQNLSVNPPEGARLLTVNTYAGDALGSILKKRVAPEESIIVATMVDITDFDKSSPLGMLTMQQIGSRLGQQGFKVLEVRLGAELKMEVHEGEFMLTRDASKLISNEYGAYAALVGVYSEKSGVVYMSTRVVRISDNAILAAYEYYVPKEGEAASMLNADSSSDNAGAWGRYAARSKAE